MAVLPRYEKLKMLLRDLAREGGMQVGDRFLSQNEIMDTYGLSFSTVTRALKELEAEGMLRRERGRGTFLAALPRLVPAQHQALRHLKVFLPWDEASARHPLFKSIFSQIQNALLPTCAITRVAFANDITLMDRQFLHDDSEIDAALFVAPPPGMMPFVGRLARTAKVAVMGAPPVPGDVSAVYTDHTSGIQSAVEVLAQQGHRHIGLMTTQRPAGTADNITTGFITAMQKHGFSPAESLAMSVPPGEGRGYQALSDLFDANTGHPLTAVILADELLAPGVVDGARMMDLRVPRDLSLLVYSDLIDLQSPPPQLTTMAVPVSEMLRLTLASLTAQVERGERARISQLSPHLHDHGSVAQPPVPGVK
ncbi:hypothetical protein CVU37_12395 [candidate division BRC1 bacterium HGW-BRC1-1]|nr:MAG: hypothetical protein CVU37_12395 [candidate division BRC1 bacterium HGW-BRC1-1]